MFVQLGSDFELLDVNGVRRMLALSCGGKVRDAQGCSTLYSDSAKQQVSDDLRRQGE
jgi:hypothetical protein